MQAWGEGISVVHKMILRIFNIFFLYSLGGVALHLSVNSLKPVKNQQETCLKLWTYKIILGSVK